jgi:hypothetical protein
MISASSSRSTSIERNPISFLRSLMKFESSEFSTYSRISLYLSRSEWFPRKDGARWMKNAEA